MAKNGNFESERGEGCGDRRRRGVDKAVERIARKRGGE